MKSSQVAPRTLARLKRQLHDLGISHATVAAEASKTSRRGKVGITAVSRTLGGHTKSANVLDTTRRLIAAAAVVATEPAQPPAEPVSA